MPKVTFSCVCTGAHVGARIELDAAPGGATDLLFEQTGKKAVDLPAGRYVLAYRAQGTPGTAFSLKTDGGATMAPIDRAIPAGGAAAGVRALVVRAAVVRAMVFVVVVSLPAVVSAQARDANGLSPRAIAERALATLPNVSDVLTPGYYLSLEASADSKIGVGTIALESASGAFGASFSLQAPLSESTKQARPLALNGLTNSAAGSVALHWFLWPGGPDVQAMRSLCRRALGKDECDDNELAGADRKMFLRLAHAGNTPTTINADVTVGRRAFRYTDRVTLDGTTESHDDVAAAFGIGHYTPHLGYVAAGYQFRREFNAGDSEQLCTLRNAGSILECHTAVVGAPARLTRRSAVVEWRWFAPGGRVAVNPSFARDLWGRVSSLDVPFYFLQLAAGGLAGGARASWRSDEPGATVAVFVGAAIHVTN